MKDNNKTKQSNFIYTLLAIVFIKPIKNMSKLKLFKSDSQEVKFYIIFSLFCSIAYIILSIINNQI
jgi:hypothetical protein